MQRRSRWSVVVAVSSFLGSIVAAAWLTTALPAHAGVPAKKPEPAEVKTAEVRQQENAEVAKTEQTSTKKKAKKASKKIDVGEFEGY